MGFLCAGRPAFTLFSSKGLLDFLVILLNLPTNGTHVMRIGNRVLRQIVCHDPFRAVFSRDPEQFHFFGARKPVDFHSLTLQNFYLTPRQFFNFW